jgi:hypothetical protein
LLIHFGLYRVTALRAHLKQRGIDTLRQTFGPRAATSPSLTLFEDLRVTGDFDGLLAWMERNFPDAVSAYAACLSADEKEEILAFMGENEQEATKSENAQTNEAARGITKQQAIRAFEGLHFRDVSGWKKALSDVPQWLEPCRVLKGKRGSNKESTLWNPVLIAIALLDKSIPIKKLDTVFVRLNDWAEEWREKSEFFRDPA